MIVARDSGRDILNAVESLLEASTVPAEIVVVDHASADGSIETLIERMPQVRVLRCPVNPGFAVGCNRGVAATTAPSVLFLNPDAELQADALPTMFHHLEREPGVGIVGPRLVHADGRLQTSAYRTPGLFTEALRLTGLANLVPRRALRRSRVARRMLPATGHFDPHDRIRDVDLVTGACMLVRRQLLEELGGFDEGYFLYYEEIDLCLRARRRGWRIVHLPSAEVSHTIGGSSRRARRVSWAARHLSRVRFHRRHTSAVRAGIIRALAAVAIATRLAVESGRRVSGAAERDRVRPADCLRVLRAVMSPSRGPSPASRLPAWLGP